MNRFPVFQENRLLKEKRVYKTMVDMGEGQD